MPTTGGVARQIIGSFEDIGKDIVHETAKVPVDIGATALESLGGGSQKKGTAAAPSPGTAGGGEGGKPQPEGPFEQFSKTTDQETKKIIARAALAQLAGEKPSSREPTVWERIQQEEAQKKEAAAERAKRQSMESVPMIRGRRRGKKFGVREKAHTEVSKNTRQD